MPRPANIIRPTQLEISIPVDLRAWLDIHLWSDNEQRIPHGSYSRLITQLIRDYKSKIEATHAAVS